MPRYILTLLLVLLTFPATAVAQDAWSPERPGQAISPRVVPEGQLSFEAGFRWERADFTPVQTESFESYGSIYEHDIVVLPSGLLRIGLGERFEFRFSSSYRRWKWAYDPNYLDGDAVADPVIRKTDVGVAFLKVGIKSGLTRERGIIPASAIIASLGIPQTGSIAYQVKYLAPDFTLAFSHALSERVTLAYHIGSRWDGFAVTPIGYYAAAVSTAFHPRLTGFVEFFGDIPGHAPPLHSVDAGLAWQALADLYLDASFGIGINAPGEDEVDFDLSSMIATDMAAEIGISWRLQAW
jgi:hypothetical protein